jgi:hypothetical protein
MGEWRAGHAFKTNKTYKIAVLGPGPEVENHCRRGKLITSVSFADGMMKDKGSKRAGTHLALFVRRLVPEATVYSVEIPEDPTVTNPDAMFRVSGWHTTL